MAGRPRALFIAPAMPALSGNGLAMRLGMFLEGLAAVAAVELVVLPIVGPAAASAALPEKLGIVPAIVPVAGRADTVFGLIGRSRSRGRGPRPLASMAGAALRRMSRPRF